MLDEHLCVSDKMHFLTRYAIRVSAAALLTAIVSIGDLARASDPNCVDPKNSCSSRVEPACLTRNAAGSMSVGEEATDRCGAQIAAYRECLQWVVANCSPPPEENAARPQGASGNSAREHCFTFDGQRFCEEY